MYYNNQSSHFVREKLMLNYYYKLISWTDFLSCIMFSEGHSSWKCNFSYFRLTVRLDQKSKLMMVTEHQNVESQICYCPVVKEKVWVFQSVKK